MLCAVLFIVLGLMGLSIQTLKNNNGTRFHGEKIFIMLIYKLYIIKYELLYITK